MQLTLSQEQALKADIIAASDPACVALEASPTNSDLAFAVKDLYNATASPDYWVWRTSVSKKEIVEQTSIDATTFTWAGNGFITRSAGELECWNQLFNSTLTCNPSLPNVRQAFQDVFSGTGNAAANRTHLLACGRRKASRVEKLLATGDGSTGTPATMGAEGPLSFQDVLDAMAS